MTEEQIQKDSIGGKKGRRILFVSYFYPPIIGSGLPGVQRTVKLLRHLPFETAHVLTLKQGNYPAYFSMCDGVEVPIKGEKVHRTGSFDFFGAIIKIRQTIKRKKKGDGCEKKPNSSSILEDEKKIGAFQIAKDFFSTLMKYPDFARPWLIYAIFTGTRVIKKNKINLIFATGMPWTSLLVGVMLKIMTGAKLIVDFRDPWVGNPYFDEKSQLEGFLDRKSESFVVFKADLVVANTPPLMVEFRERYNRLAKKMTCLPNGYDSSDFSQVRPKPSSGTKLTLTHAGLLYLKRDPRAVIEAISNFSKRHHACRSDILFRQIGGTDLGYDLRRFCEEMGVEEMMENLGPLPHKECLGYLSGSDVLLIIQPGTKTQIPSKLYEYIYLGKPILSISESGSALEELLIKYKLGKSFVPEDIDGIADYLFSLLVEKRSEKGLTRQTIPSHVRERFDVRHIIRRFDEEIKLLERA